MTDNETIISEITNSEVITFCAIPEHREKAEAEFNKLTLTELREKCKDCGIMKLTKYNKPELVQLLLTEFDKLAEALREKKNGVLRDYCKSFGIKTANVKKEDLVSAILLHIAKKGCLQLPVEAAVQKKTVSPETVLSEEPKQIQPCLNILHIESEISSETSVFIKDDSASSTVPQEPSSCKRIKQKIPKHIRHLVWNNYIGEDIIKHRCLCCKKVKMTNIDFEVGHVISEKNGGTMEITNLRPICGVCNHSMGAENMVDYVVKYGLFIG